MVSLTPGVLSKLLDNVGNNDVKVTGEHRSSLLQVIEILPSFVGGEEPWQSRGFYLKLSDSMHSAYVSMLEEDVDLIYSDKIQLGQFIYVSRLDKGSPVPLLHGLKPVPKRRPCIGNPTDLVSSDLLPIKTNLDFRKPLKGSRKNSTKDEGIKPNKFVGPEEAKSKKVFSLENKNNNKTNNNARVNVEGWERRRLSLDSVRRVWDHSPNASTSANLGFKSKPTSTSSSPNVVSDKRASIQIDPSLKSPCVSISPLRNKNENFSPKQTNAPLKKAFKSLSEGTTPSRLVKVPISFKTWSDRSVIAWNDLPSSISHLGKHVLHNRNSSFLAAVRSLEDASAEDAVIQCMGKFSELCQSPQTLSAGLFVETFLDLHLNLQRATVAVNSLLSSRSERKPSSDTSLQCLLADLSKTSTNKNALSWVQAAVESNLSKFNLFRTRDQKGVLNGEKCHYVVIDNTPVELNSESHPAQTKKSREVERSLQQNTTKRVSSSLKWQLLTVKETSNDKDGCVTASGLKEAATLAEKLLLFSREWFLKYLEDSLKVGFGIKSSEGNNEIACLLGQLKKVNLWLDDLVGCGVELDSKVENLKKKIYRFLLEHVDSAIVISK